MTNLKPRIVNTIDLPEREVGGIPVHVQKLVWNDGGLSFEVCRLDVEGDEGHLTLDGCFDNEPTDEEIGGLLTPREVWTCPGCGNSYDPGIDVVNHVNWCDRVDGAGRPRWRKR